VSDFHHFAPVLADWPSSAARPLEIETSLGARLRAALRDLQDPECPSPGPLDLAGLISHLLRREALLQGDPTLPLRVPRGEGWPDACLWSRCLCDVTRTSADHYVLQARPWESEWLLFPGNGDPLGPALMEEPRRHIERIPADPAIQEVMGLDHYLGAGQCMAVRSAMLLQPGGSLLVVLPTGGGKSLAMFAPAVLQAASDGLTLVIVPTVALALDQARRARELFANWPGAEKVGAWAYHGGLDDAEKRAIRQRIHEGTQPILFASPEAVMLSLRPALLHAAQAGRLRTFVIDEAHLVAQWGTEFRPEFQALSGLRRTLLGACGEHPPFRTLLLTATLNEEAWWTLKTLFGDGALEVCASVDLRTEPDFHLSSATNTEREDRVSELAHILPRPFILYTTKREDCEAWAARLAIAGMRRVGKMHGGTPADERELVLKRWVDRDLDVMVATSAFGLGMDQSDVRAVVHACVPETVDRFYQEVGRGGRDGKACLSFLVHTREDLNLAERLNTDRVISVDKGLARWEAMNRGAEAIGDDGSLLVRLDAKPKTVTGDSEANVAWNLRTLILMARAGLLTLEAHAPPQLSPKDGESEETFISRRQAAFEEYAAKARVRPASLDHLSKATWMNLVEQHRVSSRRADEEATQQVRLLLSGKQSLAAIFERTYRVEEAGIPVSPGMLSCPFSRRNGLKRRAGYAPRPRALEAPVRNIGPSLAAAVESRSRVFVALPSIEQGSKEAKQLQRRLTHLMERLVPDGLREISASAEWLELRDYRRLYRRAQPRIVLHTPLDRKFGPLEEALPVPRLSLLWPAANRRSLEEVLILERPLHLIFLPEDLPDLERPDRGFLDTRAHFTLADFERRLD
jgi:ATP-dependent DNA helicase RecQ